MTWFFLFICSATQLEHEQEEPILTKNFPIGWPEDDFRLPLTVRVCTVNKQSVCIEKQITSPKVYFVS